MTTTAAEILRQAAEQARAEAETHRSVVPHLIELYSDDCGSERQAVRDLAVADWLDGLASQWDINGTNLRQQMRLALPVARAYLGDPA